MIALFAELLRLHDPRMLGGVAAIAALVAAAAAPVAVRARAPGARLRRALLLALLLTAGATACFFAAVVSAFPKVVPHVPARWAVAGIAVCFGCSLLAALLQARAAQSARAALLAGSFASSGQSCLLFVFMAGIVRPFALAYDLDAVLVVTVVAAALFGIGLREAVNPGRRAPALFAASMLGLALAGGTVGSLAAILPFGGWLTAMAHDDHLASRPLLVIAAVQAATALALGLAGSLLDHRIATRDRADRDRLRELADSTLEGILIHRDGRILDGNRSVATLLGADLDELRRTPLARFLPPALTVAPADAANDAGAAETDATTAGGDTLPVEIVSRPISYGGQPALVTALRDIRERRRSEERIRFLAHHDPLTRLPNRTRLGESLQAALRRAERTGDTLAVLCLDLDGFKGVNDTLGHAAGDELLRAVAERLVGALRDGDIVARLGGDEFAVVQTTNAQPDGVIGLARRLIGCLHAPFRFDGQEIAIGTSVGISIFPADGLTAADLMKHADIALYRAKDEGRGGFCLFELGMDQELRERRALEVDLRHALIGGELTLHFQPLFDTERRVIAFEALSRWTHPVRGNVSPAVFIPLAEECGLVGSLGEWVLRAACEAAIEWHTGVRVAVNVSPRQFRGGQLPATVAAVLAETGLAADRLELEVTEGVLIDDPNAALVTLTALRALGVRLVLDDFGTGYSSLSYLHRFPFQKLKVDRSFVQLLETDESSRAIVSAIISMSRDLRLDVTAEGVETLDQFTLLCAQGCQQLQGFLLGRPVPASGLAPFLPPPAGAEAAAA